MAPSHEDRAGLGDLARVGLLQRIAELANEATSFAEAIAAALDEVCTYTGWPVGHAYIPMPGQPDELGPSTIWHLDHPERFERFRTITEHTPLRVGAGLPGRVLENGKPAWIPDVTRDANFPRSKSAAEIGVRAGFAFPVLAADKVVAVLEFFSEDAREPDVHLLNFVAYVGTQLGRVAERESAATALRQQVNHTTQLIESAHDAFVSIDKDGDIIGWNAAAEHIFGWAREEAIGRSLADTIIPPPHRAAHAAGMKRFLATGENAILNKRLELTALRRDGSELPVELAVWPVRENGDYVFCAFLRDITDRRATEQQLARLAAIVESSDDSMVTTAMDGTIVTWNHGAETLYGYSSDEAIGRPIEMIVSSPEEIPAFIEEIERGERVTHDDAIRRQKDGKLVDVSLTLSPISDESGTVVGMARITRDVSDRKRAQEQIIASEQRLLSAQQMSGIGSWEWNIEENIVTWSDQLYRNFGLTSDAFDASFKGYMDLVHPEDRMMVMSVITEALESAEPFRFEHRAIGGDGEIRVYACTGQVTARNGKPIRMAGTNEDITERTRAEDAITDAYERERETVVRLRELDQAKTIFVSSVSHELRTPLTSIIGYLEMLQETQGGGLSSTQTEMLEVIGRSSNRLLELIEDLLSFSRLEAGTFRPSIGHVSVPELFASAREAVIPDATTRALDLRFDCPDDVAVMGDSAQLERVLLNLLSNAIKFTPPEGVVSVSAERDGDHVTVTVRDSGIGIPADEMSRLFSPFFRSSNAEGLAVPGTGLGLSIVKAIVDGHGGKIDIRSGSEGTTVVIRLPTSVALSRAPNHSDQAKAS